MSVNPKKVREILDKNILADGFEPIIDLDKSHGSWIVDQRNGNELLDMFSMYASGSVGYNHPKIVASKDKLRHEKICLQLREYIKKYEVYPITLN